MLINRKLSDCPLFENIFIPIPNEILQSENYKDIKNDILQFNNTHITEVVKEDGFHIRIFTPKENTNTIRIMLEMVIENEMKIRNYEKAKYENLQKLEDVQKEMSKIKKYYIEKELLGLVIGSKVIGIF
jgi:hypothetical protein